MGLRGKLFKGSVVIASTEALTYGSSFLRNMLLARLISKADFGIAASFGMVLAVLEFSGRLAASRFVVQDKEGNEPEFVATAHFIQFIAGALSTLLMLLAIGPLSELFGLQDYKGTFKLLAFFPVVRSLEHLDPYRLEREFKYTKSSLVSLVPNLAITLACWPTAILLPDYRSILILLSLKALLGTGCTHYFAERPYRWATNPVYRKRLLRFGLPLLVNGFLLFGVYQGDQFLVSCFYPKSDLGAYAAAAALATAPSFIVARVLSSLMLPMMAKVQDDGVAFVRCYQLCLQAVVALSVIYSTFVIVGAESWMVIAYGKKYAGAGILLSWLAASNSFRIIRIAPSIAALAKADSNNQLHANLLRILSLIPAALLAKQGAALWTIGATCLLGEALACGYSVWRLSKRDAIPISHALLPFGLTVVATSVACALHPIVSNLSLPLGTTCAALLSLATGVGLVWVFGDLRDQVRGFLTERRAKLA